MIHQIQKKREEKVQKIRDVEILFNNFTLVSFRHIQIMKAMTNGATLIKKGAVELHILLPRCKDHPELVVDDDDAARAEVTPDSLLLLELGEVEPVVVPVRGEAVVASAPAELPAAEADGTT